MTEIQSESTPRTPFARRLLRAVLALLLVVIACWALIVFAINGKVESARAAAEEAKPLLSYDEVFSGASSGDTINGSDVMEAAVILAEGQDAVRVPRMASAPQDLQEVRQRLIKLALRQTPPEAEDLNAFRALVDNYSLSLAVLDDAWRRDVIEAHYPVHLDGPPLSIIIPNLLTRMRLADLVAARAFVALDAGDLDAALRDAALTWRIATWTTNEMPTLINGLVGRAIAVRANYLTEQIFQYAHRLDSTDASTNFMQALRETGILQEARRISPQSQFDFLMEAERSMLFMSFLDPRVDVSELAETERVPSLPERWSWTRGPWLRLNAAVYLESATKAFEICSRPTSLHGENVDAEMAAHTVPQWAQIARLGFFNCIEVAHKRDHWTVMIDHLDIALKLEEVRAAEGAYPDDLSALRDIPLDPFSGEAYRYRKDGDGYKLWSVSANGIDDEATGFPLGENRAPVLTEGDIVWSVGVGG